MKPTLAEVVAVLRAANIPHALIGAAAMNVRGVSRATNDDDLLVRAPAVLDPSLWERFEHVDVRLGDHDDPLAGVVRMGDPNSIESTIDIVVPKYVWMDGILSNATQEQYNGVRVPVATTVDLILLKLFAGGFKDRNDIAMLLGRDDRSELIRQVDARIDALDEEAQTLWTEIKRVFRA